MVAAAFVVVPVGEPVSKPTLCPVVVVVGKRDTPKRPPVSLSVAPKGRVLLVAVVGVGVGESATAPPSGQRRAGTAPPPSVAGAVRALEAGPAGGAQASVYRQPDGETA